MLKKKKNYSLLVPFLIQNALQKKKERKTYNMIVKNYGMLLRFSLPSGVLVQHFTLCSTLCTFLQMIILFSVFFFFFFSCKAFCRVWLHLLTFLFSLSLSIIYFPFYFRYIFCRVSMFISKFRNVHIYRFFFGLAQCSADQCMP